MDSSSEITKVELAESVPSTGNAPTNPTFVSGANLLKNVEKSYDKDKKLLEESEWNPQFHIAYHGSGAKCDEFDHSHMGEVIRRQWLGDKHTSISLHRDGKSESWVLTGYKIDYNTDAKDRGNDLSNATQIYPTPTREDLGAALKSNVLKKKST